MALTPPAFNNYVFLLNLFAKVLLTNLNTQNYADGKGGRSHCKLA